MSNPNGPDTYPSLSAEDALRIGRAAFSIIMGQNKGMKEKIVSFACRLTDEELKVAENVFYTQGPAIWRYWCAGTKAREKKAK